VLRDGGQVFNLLRTGHRLTTCATGRLPLGEASAVDPARIVPCKAVAARPILPSRESFVLSRKELHT